MSMTFQVTRKIPDPGEDFLSRVLTSLEGIHRNWCELVPSERHIPVICLDTQKHRSALVCCVCTTHYSTALSSLVTKPGEEVSCYFRAVGTFIITPFNSFFVGVFFG